MEPVKQAEPRGRRVPVLLQMTAAECGAACAAMVLSAYGRATRVRECREDMDVGRDGANALQIAQSLRRPTDGSITVARRPSHFSRTR